MLLEKKIKMKLSDFQKKILIVLLVLCILTPAGILLPVFFNAGTAWGEWSAQTVKDLVGYVPKGLAKYSDVWKAPLPDYTLGSKDVSIVRQSGYYFVSCLIGATLTFIIMLLISKIMIRHGE
jgi:cobalt/nickel transport protein